MAKGAGAEERAQGKTRNGHSSIILMHTTFIMHAAYNGADLIALFCGFFLSLARTIGGVDNGHVITNLLTVPFFPGDRVQMCNLTTKRLSRQEDEGF